MGLEIQVKKGTYGKSSDPMRNFMKKLKNPESRRQYPRRLKYFMDALYTVQDKDDPEKDAFRPLTNKDDPKIEEQVNEFMKHKDDPEWIKDAFFLMLDVHKRRVKAGKITDTTIFNYYKAAKKFCDANEIKANWDAILDEVPVGRKRADDRKPTLEEIRKLVSYHDKRIKAIVYTMVSSGIRISSWNYLKWGDIEPYYDKNGKVTCAKLTAYNIKKKNVNDGDKYYTTFITPEAFYELEEWINFRIAHGEDINKKSLVMRDLFESTKRNGNNVGNINNPKPLKSTGIKTMLERAARSAKLFEPLKDGQKRREWKLSHGLRKWFKSRAEDVMKSLVVETLLAHDTHLGESYYRPDENELKEQYLKAVPLLTIEEANLKEDKLTAKITEDVTKKLESKYTEQNMRLMKEMQEQLRKQRKDFLAYIFEQKFIE
jgi:hypothetical protein